ncbi:peptidyl-prolyl cis-trans isomerase C [Deinococcus metalli]|uniref:peptidylprolyl isomerase n=1 Tax=Deinococcus metalli TaxID=1141878 RepID=A0A7W8NQW2_9DEIO|nr:peptidylprolyl isomerase [Deinococcus metalli]MBB5377270.1 peptidyl-prolyl cis-trans isomerase C [Deinococcus metalli]GHF47737.1 peptidylprolyl isomerase [Deinococcus metalli]
MKRKPLVNGLLIVLAILLVAGMAYQFTPALQSGSLFGSKQTGTPALTVNGQTITAEELEAVKTSNAVLGSVDTGVLADDFKTYIVQSKVREKLITEAVQDIKVSRDDVNADVKKIREQNQLTDNKAWTDALQSRGFTDSSFREQVRASLAYQRKVDDLKKAAPAATDAEAKAYYDLNPQAFQSDARIVGRQIVVTDKAKAAALLAQVKGGADFAKLAGENNAAADFKDRGGALGPIESGAPRPVAQVALPTEVGPAAFALTQGGVTDVIASGGKFYIVKVEKYLAPAPKPYADAKTDAMTAVSEEKKNAALETWIAGLEKGVKIEFMDPNWKVENPTVATVAGQDISYSEVLEQVVNNQQFSQLLQQVPAEQAAGLVNGILKPQVVQQLIQGYAAPSIAQKLKLDLAGSRQEVAAGLAAYGARDVKVTDADIQAFYDQNKSQFETPASGTVAEASFKDQAKAVAFQSGWNGSGSFTGAATKGGGTVSEHGAVTAGDGKLGAELNAAVFTAKTLRTAGEGSLSDVVKVGDRYSVLYVTDLKAAATQPLSAVRSQIETQVLASKKQEAGQKFLSEQVATLKPVDKLKDVLAAQAKRVAAATPKTTTPATGSGAATPGSATPATPGSGSAPATSTPETK